MENLPLFTGFQKHPMVGEIRRISGCHPTVGISRAFPRSRFARTQRLLRLSCGMSRNIGTKMGSGSMTFLGETHYETRGLLVQVGIFEGRGLRIWLHRLNIYEYRTKLGMTKVVLRGSWGCHHCKTDRGPP